MRLPARTTAVQPPVEEGLGGTMAVLAARAYRTAAAAAAAHGAASAATRAVESELAAARQRLRALQHRLLPSLQDALRRLELELAECEQAEAVQRKRAGSRTVPGRPEGPRGPSDTPGP